MREVLAFPWFHCPLCKSDSYQRVNVILPSGAIRATEFYSCCGCSVMFTDPDKFTTQKKLTTRVKYAYGSHTPTGTPPEAAAPPRKVTPMRPSTKSKRRR